MLSATNTFTPKHLFKVLAYALVYLYSNALALDARILACIMYRAMLLHARNTFHCKIFVILDYYRYCYLLPSYSSTTLGLHAMR
jgi:hypothetical protein